MAGAAVLAALLLGGCEPPAMEVGSVGYSVEQVDTLDVSERQALARLTAFGLAIAEGQVDAVIDPEVRSDLRSIVLQRVAMEIAVEHAGIDDAELREAYARDPEQELRVRHLVVLSERWRPPEHRDSARARAAEALDRARAGEDFEALVAEYSDEPQAADRGGLLRPGREGSWVPEFWAAASSLEEGKISDVVETEFGYHVIRLEERRAVPFEEARDRFLESFMDLPMALQRASTRVAAVQSTMRVDTAAVRAWQSGEPVDRPLVQWPDSLAIDGYDAEALERYIRSSRPETVSDVRALDPGSALDVVTGSTRTHVLLERARALGIEPSESQRSAIREQWRARVSRWATALRFEAGLSPSEVGTRALDALVAEAQSAVRARSELARLDERLEELYPVRLSAEDTSIRGATAAPRP